MKKMRRRKATSTLGVMSMRTPRRRGLRCPPPAFGPPPPTSTAPTSVPPVLAGGRGLGLLGDEIGVARSEVRARVRALGPLCRQIDAFAAAFALGHEDEAVRLLLLEDGHHVFHHPI